ncbi:hypothetical protein B0T39_23840 [Chromobacterium haemolyticum]|nr:hypothetical protein B0T39_23840 [Chromobacterium haemolyticum]
MTSSDLGGNPDALRARKTASQQTTRHELNLALARLRNGNPKRVPRGSPISASTVAEEAGIDRSTLYRYHEPVLIEIRKINDTAPKQKLQAKQGELVEEKARTMEYRKIAEDATAEIADWARQNYALSHRIQELEQLLHMRDGVIDDLKNRLQVAERVVPMRAVPDNK